MAKKISVQVDVATEQVTFATDQILTLTQKVKILKRELQTVPEGTAEWQTLNQAFNDNKDALDRVNVKSRELFGTISLLPGPLGDVANSVDNAINSFKIFSSIKTTDLKANLAAVAGDFKEILSTLGRVTGITKVYTVLNNALAASFVKVGVGEQAAAAGARTFAAALTATGIGAIVVALGFAVSALMEWTEGTEKATKAQDKFNKELDRANELLDLDIAALKRSGAERIAYLKSKGATEAEIEQATLENLNKEKLRLTQEYNASVNAEEDIQRNRRDKNSVEDLKKQQAKSNELLKKLKDTDSAITISQYDAITTRNKANEEATKKRTEENKRIAAETKQRLAQEKADQIAAQKDKEARDSAAFKVERDAYVATLEERNAELYKVDEDYEERRKTLLRAGITDFTAIEEQRRIEKMNVNYKFDKAEAEIRDKALEDARTAQLQAYDDEITLLEAQGKSLLEGSEAYFDNAYAIEEAAYQRKLLAADGNAKAIEAIQAEHSKNMLNIEQQESDAKRKLLIARFELVEQFGNLLGQIAGKNKKLAIAGIVIEKAATIAKVIAQMSGVPAILPPGIPNPAFIPAQIGGALSIAATVAGAAKSIAEINAVQTPGGSGGGTSGGGSAPSIPAYSTQAISAPSMGRSQSQTGVLAGIVQGAVQRDNSRDRPLRAYVVGSDVTTNQQLDRRIRTAARLG